MSVNEPRTNNPGLGSYVGRTLGIAIFLTIVLLFTSVHFYYATSALLDLLADFILFLFLFFLGMSLMCLALCARVGPGDLPSRFSAARMETYIRDELRRVVAKAQAARGGAAPLPQSPPGSAAADAADAADAAGVGAVQGRVHDDHKSNWKDIDDAEEHQLANVASAAALTQRSSAQAAEREWEQKAAEARLRMDDDGRGALHSSSEEHGAREGDGDVIVAARHRHGRSQEGDESMHGRADENEEEGEDAAAEPPELPAYMSEMMQRRRLRKVRRGLEVVPVSVVAQRVLDAMDSDDFDRKREEMGYLIPGANWCRFCSFYQMNETRHCTVCGRCVYRSKVHCVCCGKCIGYANSKYYVLFLFYLVMALLFANFLDLYCIGAGFTFFFKKSGESNSVYYLVFVYSYAVAVLTLTVLVHYLLAAGRNVGLLTELQREQREELESVRIRNSGELYEPIMAERTVNFRDKGTESPDQGREPFVWSRAMNVVGEGLPLPLWFWPVPTRPAVKEMEDPEEFWANLTEAIRLRLRSVADEDDAFSEDDDSAEGGGELAEAPQHAAPATAAMAGVAVAAAQPAPKAAAAAAAVSHKAKSAEVVVTVPVPAAATAPPPHHEVDLSGSEHSDGDQAGPMRHAVTPPAPPVAKVAPAPRKKLD